MSGNLLMILVLIILEINDVSGACQDQWPSCKRGGMNIVCLNGGRCKPHAGNCKLKKMTNFIRNLLLDRHNELRNKVASGEETRGFAKSAANMMVLSYATDLEYTASCNVMACAVLHDPCHITERFSLVGQNLWTGPNMRIDAAPNAWLDQIVNMTADFYDKYGIAPRLIGQFTQLAWAETTFVGCAIASEGDDFYLTCNYATAGNVLDKSVYIKGDPASQCPSGVSRNKKYTALCGEQIPLGQRRNHFDMYLMFGMICIIFCLV